MFLYGCSLNGEKNLTLVCIGKSTQTETDLVTKVETKHYTDTRVVYKIENGKYRGYDCKFTKEEIICDTSKLEDESSGELKFNRVSGTVSDILDFKVKNGLNKFYLREHLEDFGTCEISKQNKF
jgi:hypothetical protein